jgi:hypothetical protein
MPAKPCHSLAVPSSLFTCLPAWLPLPSSLRLMLYRVTEKGNYTEKDAAHIIRQILQGVRYLHLHGGHGRAQAGGQLRSAAAVAGACSHWCATGALLQAGQRATARIVWRVQLQHSRGLSMLLATPAAFTPKLGGSRHRRWNTMRRDPAVGECQCTRDHHRSLPCMLCLRHGTACCAYGTRVRVLGLTLLAALPCAHPPVCAWPAPPLRHLLGDACSCCGVPFPSLFRPSP